MRLRLIVEVIAIIAVAGCGSSSSRAATDTAVTTSPSTTAAPTITPSGVPATPPTSLSTPPTVTSPNSAAPTTAQAEVTVPASTEAPTTTVPALTGNWQSSDVGTDLFLTVSCAARNFCVAINQTDNAYIYNGASWSAPTPADSPYNVKTVSCPSATMCVVADIQGGYSLFNGSTWTQRKNISKEHRSDSIDGLACPTTTFCIAVTNSGAAITFDGRAWSPPTMMDPPAAAAIDAINAGGNGDLPVLHLSCSSAQFCMIVDNLGSAIPYANGAWGPPVQLDTAAGKPEALSCSPDTFCVAAESGSTYFTFDGTTWSAGQTSPQTVFGPLACSSKSFCMTTGNYWSIFDGTTWRSSFGHDSNGQGPSQTFALSCTPDKFCVSAGAYASISLYTP